MHRDLKPENLLVTKNFDVKLCDFGWGAEFKNGGDPQTIVCGTFEYMPPEVDPTRGSGKSAAAHAASSPMSEG